MSDVIWAATIASGVSLIGSVTTYLVSKNQSDANLAGIEQQTRPTWNVSKRSTKK